MNNKRILLLMSICTAFSLQLFTEELGSGEQYDAYLKSLEYYGDLMSKKEKKEEATEKEILAQELDAKTQENESLSESLSQKDVQIDDLQKNNDFQKQELDRTQQEKNTLEQALKVQSDRNDTFEAIQAEIADLKEQSDKNIQNITKSLDNLTVQVGGEVQTNAIVQGFVNTNSNVTGHITTTVDPEQFDNALKNAGNKIGQQAIIWNRVVKQWVAKEGAQYAMIGAAGLGLLASGFYGARLGWKFIEKKVLHSKPTGVEVVYAKDWLHKRMYKKMKEMFTGKKEKQLSFNDMIFGGQMKELLQRTLNVTIGIKREIKRGNKAVKYRNCFASGLPGTGKTMAFKILAKLSGMDFMYIPAATLLANGIQYTTEVFESAKNSPHGTILLIDEADSLFTDRNMIEPGSLHHNIINMILTCTGERSDKFMVVIATNHPQVMDNAVQRRFDDYFAFELPGLEQRVAALKLYRDSLVCNTQNHAKIIQSGKAVLTEQKIEDIARVTEGLSYGHLSGIMNRIATEGLGAKYTIVEGMVNRIVNNVTDFARAFDADKKRYAKAQKMTE